MMLNIIIVLIMFIPFYVALIYKHSGWLTAIMMFLWCSCTSSLMILLVALAFVHELFMPIPMVQMLAIILWGVFSTYMGLKTVFSDHQK